MNITSEFKNDLLKRREVVFTDEHESNPGFAGVAKKTAEHFKVDENCVAVKEVNGKFGTDKYTARVFVYSTFKDKESTEPKPKVKAKKEGTA